jgi:hypothetical protein
LNVNLEQLIEDGHTSNDIGKLPGHSRRTLLLMLALATLASQALAGCSGNGGDGGGAMDSSTSAAANTMSIISTDPNNAANNFTQTFLISLTIGDGEILAGSDGGPEGTWAWIIRDLGDPGDYPFQVQITTPTFDELIPPTNSSLNVAYEAANILPRWVLLYGNGIYGAGSPLVITRTPNGKGYTYNLSFSASHDTQMVSGTASFDVTTFPGM